MLRAGGRGHDGDEETCAVHLHPQLPVRRESGRPMPGLEPGKLNPLAVKVMRDAGTDISRNTTQSVFDLFKGGKRFQYVISVCDDASAERCPIFPGVTTRMSWSFADPSAFTGTEQERLEQTIRVRDEIRERIRRWVEEEEASQPLFGRTR